MSNHENRRRPSERDGSSDPVLEMRGVGKEIWREQGGDSLVAEERQTWESDGTPAKDLVKRSLPGRRSPPSSGRSASGAVLPGRPSCEAILKMLRALANPKNVEGMARFGISTRREALGITTPVLQRLARGIGHDHALALELWESGVLEARCLAALIDDPKLVSEAQMERWVRDFDNWAVCDTCCGRLFDRTPFAYRKALEWSRREEEYVKRAAFSLMAVLAVHDKQASDSKFLRLLPVIKRGSTDERNFVKKAVNWAVRQIGKRNRALNKAAIKTAQEIQEINSRSARWIAAHALRELRSEAVQRRLRQKR